MGNFLIYGTVIDENNTPKEGLKISAYDSDQFLNADDFLGESVTDSDGYFSIQFDTSKFQGFWEILEGSPDIYLKIQNHSKKVIIQTRTEQTKNELEYHIKLGNQKVNPETVDIYANNTQKIISMLNDVGLNVGEEFSINLDSLTNNDLPDDVRKRLEEFLANSEQRTATFNNLMAVLSGLVNSALEEQNFGTIDYDGPQVPRLPWKENYNQVIIWPRDD